MIVQLSTLKLNPQNKEDFIEAVYYESLKHGTVGLLFLEMIDKWEEEKRKNRDTLNKLKTKEKNLSNLDSFLREIHFHKCMVENEVKELKEVLRQEDIDSKETVLRKSYGEDDRELRRTLGALLTGVVSHLDIKMYKQVLEPPTAGQGKMHTDIVKNCWGKTKNDTPKTKNEENAEVYDHKDSIFKKKHAPEADFFMDQLALHIGKFDQIGHTLNEKDLTLERIAMVYTRAVNFATIQRIRNEFVNDVRRIESYGWIKGVLSMLTADYIVESWRANEDDGDLISDVANLNTQVGLISALILTVVIPLYTAQAPINGTPEDEKYPTEPIAQCWLFFIALATLAESVCLLVAIRNLIVLNLVENHNASEFMGKGSDVMLMPVRLNFVAVLATFLALNFFSIYSYGQLNWLGFLIIIIIPCVIIMLHSIGAGIAALHSTQPWHREKFWLQLHKNYEDSRAESKCRPSSTSSISPGPFAKQ